MIPECCFGMCVYAPEGTIPLHQSSLIIKEQQSAYTLTFLSFLFLLFTFIYFYLLCCITAAETGISVTVIGISAAETGFSVTEIFVPGTKIGYPMTVHGSADVLYEENPSSPYPPKPDFFDPERSNYHNVMKLFMSFVFL